MKKNVEPILSAVKVLLAPLMLMLIVVGCGNFDAPTASQPTASDNPDFWNPAPGDQINGHEVPLVREGYWESIYGPQINPWWDAQASATIGRNGGILRMGPHTLVVPRGALSSSVTIRVRVASLTAIAVDCDPSPFQFNCPVQLTLSYAGTQYDGNGDGGNPPLNIFYMAADGSLEQLSSTVSRESSTVTAFTDHFSRYIIG